MTEIELHRGGDALAVQMDYARAVSSASMLPTNYRGKPADIMLAVGLGQAMGLSPAESLYRIDVIQGKPTASAELIAANVRKAGHKLRVKIDEENLSVTATIIRADDPDDPHPPTVTRDRKWASDMGLLSKDNYKKQPLTMLQWRAITAVARLACPEALYGVAYSADELGDMGGWDGTTEPPRQSGLAAAMQVEQVTPEPSGADPAVGAADAPDPGQAVEPESAPESASEDGITSSQLKKMGALMREVGLTERDGAIAFVVDVVGRDVDSRNDLSKAEASDVIDALETERAAQPTLDGN